MSATLVLSGSVVTAMGLLFIAVGRSVRSDQGRRPERLARDAFALWWFAFGGSTLISAVQTFLVAAGVEDLALYVSLSHVSLLLLFLALWGLMYYLLYLYTGWQGVVIPITVFYGLFFIVGIYVVTFQNPVGLQVGEWTVTLVYESQLGGWLVGVLQFALIAPLVVGVVLYLLLYFKLDEPVQKTRIVLVGGALLFWFGGTGFAVWTGLDSLMQWPLVSRLLALTAAVVIMYAFTGLERKRRQDPTATRHAELSVDTQG